MKADPAIDDERLLIEAAGLTGFLKGIRRAGDVSRLGRRHPCRSSHRRLDYYDVPNVDEVFARAVDARRNRGDGDYGSPRRPLRRGTHLGAGYVPDRLRDVTIYLPPVETAKLIDFP